MRKFTLILSMLVAMVTTAMAQEVYVTDLNDLSNEKTYLIESARCVLINSENVTTGLATTNGKSVGTVTRSIDDPNQQFKIEKDGENYYLYSVGADKYVAANGDWSDTKSAALTITDVRSRYAGYPWKLSMGSNYLNSQDPNQTAEGIMVNGWSDTDPGNCYRFVDIEATKAAQFIDVTYVYMLDGVEKNRTTVKQAIGSDYEAPAVDYVTFEYPAGNVTTETTEVSVTCTQNLPFVLSVSYAEAKWYYMTIRSNGQKYVSRSETAPYNNSTSVPYGANGRWAFTGNVFDGIQILNNGAGADYALGYDNTNTGSNVYMKNSETSWIIEEGVGGFLLRQSGDNEYIHDYGSKLQFWNSGSAATDPGSAFIAYPAEDIESGFDIATWKENELSVLGRVGGYDKDLRDEIEAIDNYAGYENFTTSNSPIAVSTDVYYRLVCVAPKTGNSGDTNYNTLTFNGNANIVTAPASSSNFNQIFQFENAGEGKFYLKNANADGYLNKITAGGYRSAVVDQADACKIQLLSYGNAQWEINNSDGEGHHSLFAENSPTETIPYACSGWDDGANSASAWYIIPAEEIEITVSEVGYATLYSPVALTVPSEGVTAHTVTVDGEWAVFGDALTTIPANTGVILNGAGTHTFAITTAPEFDGDNLLTGTTVATEITKQDGYSYYILANGEKGVGLYNPVLGDDDTKFNNAANKAYLAVPAEQAQGVASYSFRFDGTTGIENVESQSEGTAIYDLMGRRVENPTRGIYVINGKKVLVK